MAWPRSWNRAGNSGGLRPNPRRSSTSRRITSGRAVRQDFTPVKEHDPGAVAGQAQVFSQEDQGEVPGPAEAVQGGQEFLHPQRIEIGGGFVQDQKLRRQGQDRGQGQELSLPAGEGGGVPVLQPGQPDQGQTLCDPAPQFLPGQPQVFRAEGHLLVHPGGEELGLEILEQNPHPPGQLPGPAGGGEHPVHLDPARETPP